MHHSNTIWASLRQILLIENQYSLVNQLNRSFYIYFTIHSCSNGQELVEKSSVPLCAMFCDAKCDILSQVTGTSLCGIADYQVIKLLTVYSASTSDYEICHGDM